MQTLLFLLLILNRDLLTSSPYRLRFERYPESRQPFSVTFSSEALLFMDMHSHLSPAEILGCLGGTWDPSKKGKILPLFFFSFFFFFWLLNKIVLFPVLEIQVALPCKITRAYSDNGTMTIEMDRTEEMEIRQQIDSLGVSNAFLFLSLALLKLTSLFFFSFSYLSLGCIDLRIPHNKASPWVT